MPNHYIQVYDNKDLTDERKNCPFDTDTMCARIYGDPDFVKRRKEILSYVKSIPELNRSTTDTSFMTRMEMMENSAKNTVLLFKYRDKILDPSSPAEYSYLKQLVVGEDGFPLGLHHNMLIPMLQVNCDQEQSKVWLPRALNGEFVGTYAQTEMGHGTNLKKLETTATYDPQTKEFILHSPTVTASKWLPGNLGKSSNFIVVMAQLWTQGKCFGPHAFMVQIRHPETHEPMPGVTVGDIGPKIGINTNDNGFLRFSNVRIPRRNMLMGHSKVDVDGTYQKPIHPKIGYASMMFVRSYMIHGMAYFLAQAATISVRYSCVRRQGQIDGKEEVKVMDYQTQQYRILPQLARAYCFQYAGHYSRDLYNLVMEEVKNGKADLMSDLHALNCGLKSVTSFQTAQGIEQCRMSCGGHGYSKGSGIPQIFGIAVGGCTYEGENIVMLLQLARFLMKLAPQVRAGKPKSKPSELTQYLFEFKQASKRSTLKSGQDKHEQWWAIQAGFEHISRQIIMRAFQNLEKTKHRGLSHDEAWVECGVEMTKAARAHTRTFLSKNFIQAVQKETDPAIKKVLSDVLHVYIHYELLECRADHFEDGYLSSAQCDFSRNQLYLALAEMRKNVVNLVDSFDFDDRVLNSCLGRRDGDVYEALFRWAKQSELNQTQVLPFHHETLGKLLKENREKHGSKL